jgi:FG-GAP repeat
MVIRPHVLGWCTVAAVAALVAPAHADPVSLGAADFKITGAPGQSLGFRVGPAGDLDGDRHDDIVVGAWQDGTNGVSAGAAYVVYGPVTSGRISVADADAKLLGELKGDFAGEGWAGVGDLNADGYDDLVVGAPGSATGQPGDPAPGTAYLFYGGRKRMSGTLDLTDADATLVGESNVDFAGLSIASRTNVDGDHYDDLVIGAPRDDAGGAEAGAVYVLRGGKKRLRGAVSLATADAKFVGAPGDLAGFRINAAGDVDRDHRDDVLIGATAQPGFGGSGIGSAYLLYGDKRSPHGTVSLPTGAAHFLGEDTDDRPGFGLGGGGDLNGDHFDDVVVAADLEDTAGVSAGAAYVFYGRRARLTGTVSLGTADAKLTGEATNDRAGFAAAVVPDLDRDGFDEIAVGAFQPPAGNGAAYVLYGDWRRLSGTSSLATADVKLTGEAAADAAGFSVGGAGDINGDRVCDLMVGAMSHDLTGSDSAGAVYVRFGERHRHRWWPWWPRKSRC